jgi:hypothetical protein
MVPPRLSNSATPRDALSYRTPNSTLPSGMRCSNIRTSPGTRMSIGRLASRPQAVLTVAMTSPRTGLNTLL